MSDPRRLHSDGLRVLRTAPDPRGVAAVECRCVLDGEVVESCAVAVGAQHVEGEAARLDRAFVLAEALAAFLNTGGLAVEALTMVRELGGLRCRPPSGHVLVASHTRVRRTHLFRDGLGEYYLVKDGVSTIRMTQDDVDAELDAVENPWGFLDEFKATLKKKK